MAGIFGVNTSGRAYPEGPLIFGSDYAGRDYVTPMARFDFYDNRGNLSTNAPTIYIKMPGAFNSTLINSYQEASNIFGNPSGDNKTLDILAGITESAGTSLQRQILSGVAGAAGFIGSFGLGGKTQVEFLTRRFLNNFQQLVYQGPTFRRYQLPFSMKPTSEEEARNMGSIIHTFRAASSPNAIDISDSEVALQVRNATENALETVTAKAAEDLTDEDKQILQQINEQTSDYNAQELLKNNSVDTLAFAYPDMCKFQIILDLPGTGINDLTTVFESEFCMIESVSVDYGGQNKMQFFEAASDGLYYPTDVTLSISLREAVLTTAGLTSEQFNRNQTIL